MSYTPLQPVTSSQVKRVLSVRVHEPPPTRSRPPTPLRRYPQQTKPPPHNFCVTGRPRPLQHHITFSLCTVLSYQQRLYSRHQLKSRYVSQERRREKKSICRSCHSHACSLAHSHAHTLHYSYIDNWPAQNTAKKKQSPYPHSHPKRPKMYIDRLTSPPR